jgi:hypothetical protein
VRPGQRGQLGEDGVVLAEPQPGVDAVLQRGQPGLHQPDAQPLPGLLRAGRRQRRAGPQVERRGQPGDPRRVVRLRRGRREPGLEPVHVDRRRVHDQRVRAAGRPDLRLGRVHPGPGERRPQAGDVDLDRVPGGPRRLVRPGQLDQPLGRHRPVGLQREHREHEPLPARAEPNRPPGVCRGDPTQQPDLHQTPRHPTGRHDRRTGPPGGVA